MGPHIENIELTTKHDVPSAYNVAPSQTSPYDGDSKQSDTNAYLPQNQTIENWPIQSQQVATLTPLRGTILAFDIVLASSPLLFIGMYRYI